MTTINKECIIMDINNLLVFISHNKADKDTARQIGMSLVAEEIKVWFDEWEISAGDSIVEQINTGLKGCTHFIVIWSKNSAKSNWVRRELNSTLNRAIQSGAPKLIPIILDETPIPELLAGIQYIKYEEGSKTNRGDIIRTVIGREPTSNFIKAVVNKYNETIYEENSIDPLPFKACPNCGSDRFERSSFTDYSGDEVYYLIKCKECGWNDWTQ